MAVVVETRIFVDDFGYLRAMELMQGVCARCEEPFERWVNNTWHVLAGADAAEVLHCSISCARNARARRKRAAKWDRDCFFPQKIKHPSRSVAEAVVRKLARVDDDKMVVYPCRAHWHVGHDVSSATNKAGVAS